MSCDVKSLAISFCHDLRARLVISRALTMAGNGGDGDVKGPSKRLTDSSKAR